MVTKRRRNKRYDNMGLLRNTSVISILPSDPLGTECIKDMEYPKVTYLSTERTCVYILVLGVSGVLGICLGGEKKVMKPYLKDLTGRSQELKFPITYFPRMEWRRAHSE